MAAFWIIDKAKYAAELGRFLFSTHKTDLSWTTYARVFYSRLNHEPLGRLRAVFHDFENHKTLRLPLSAAAMAVVLGRFLAR